MVVNDCIKATAIDSEQGLETYTNQECASAADIKSMTPNLSFQSKVMTQAALDPVSFYDNDEPSIYFTQ